MKFTLEIELSTFEVEEWGIDSAIIEHLDYVRERVYLGNTKSGIVRDVNGNPIGEWKTTEVEGK